MQTHWFPLMIGVVMLSLGLTLTVSDFRRVAEIPGPVAAALFCQIVVLPAFCFLLARLFALPPALAVGLMLVAASPGGAMANVFSHLANGDLALNLTLTAINAVLSIVTLPLILALAFAGFMEGARTIPLQYGKFLQVFAFIAVPVALGMLLRARFPPLANRLRRPIKVAAGFVLAAMMAIGLTTGWDTLRLHFPVLGGAVLSLCIVSLVIGYWVPRWLQMGHRRAIAISLEIGLHNAVLAIAIAMSPSLLDNPDMAVPATLYGTVAIFVASVFIFIVGRLERRSAEHFG